MLESPLPASRSYTGTVEQSKLTSVGGNGDCQGTSDGRRDQEEGSKTGHKKGGAEDPPKQLRDELSEAFSYRKKKRAKGTESTEL